MTKEEMKQPSNSEAPEAQEVSEQAAEEPTENAPEEEEKTEVSEDNSESG